ncbi:MAG: 3'(2'),5'-bisphosphate nucleotidase [Pelagibacterium sp. SCN 64-44]|nr:MAG: 3'(2'),5'-bisphosphate nucleotidase [Pelagibacterium sp. SCN 64-44]
MPPLDPALTELALSAALRAADIICDIYSRPIEAIAKQDGSPVTQADRAAEQAILAMLAPTGIPVLAEESAAAGIIPELGNRYFVVDPLDGTKEFIKRNGEFAVNIGLVEAGFPVMGVIVGPVSGAIYIGDASGAWFCRRQNGALGPRERMEVSQARRPCIVASRSHGHAALAQLRRILDVESDVSVGSSLKFGLLAHGDAQLYPRFTPTCEWDTAAGQAIVEAAGGAVITLDGARLSYGKRETGFLNPFFVAAASLDLAQRTASEMRSLLGSPTSHAT